jgi:hypothetical protein
LTHICYKGVDWHMPVRSEELLHSHLTSSLDYGGLVLVPSLLAPVEHAGKAAVIRVVAAQASTQPETDACAWTT